MKNQEKPFYVYVHKYASGPKHGQVFYVGKGKGRRAWARNGRSIYWKRIVDKYGFDWKITLRFKTEFCAFSLEKAIISYFGKDNLCNLTYGGEGCSGRIVSDETRAKVSKSNGGLNHPLFGLFGVDNPHYGLKRSIETKLKISASKSGKNHPNFGKSISNKTKEKIRASQPRNIAVTNGIGDIFNSMSDATRWLQSIGFDKACNQAISACCSGKRSIAYGYKWSYAK